MYCPSCGVMLTRTAEHPGSGCAIDSFDAECPECKRNFALDTDLQDDSLSLQELSPAEVGVPDSVKLLRRITA